jgi:hypothetical protein
VQLKCAFTAHWRMEPVQDSTASPVFRSALLGIPSSPSPQVVPAQYAFVVHTADPLTGDAGTTVGELVVGMGEALVGNLPGRALSFSAAAGTGE